MEKEVRILANAGIQVRAKEDGSESKVILGTGVVFGQESQLMWDFVEVIEKNSFDDADISDVGSYWNHDHNFVLGRSTSGTLKFTITDENIPYEIDAPDTQTIRDLVLSPIERKDVVGSSFGFSIRDGSDHWEYDKDRKIYIRFIRKVQRLYDLSPVANPAYLQTSTQVSKRALEGLQDIKKRTNTHSKAKYYDMRARILIHSK